jgi:predicted amidohydrolase
MTLKISTIQMRFTGDVSRNRDRILDYVGQAAEAGSNIVHFSEVALTGYAGSDIDSNEGIDWESVEDAVDQVRSVAANKKIWVVLGTAYRAGDGLKPYNSLLLINDAGAIIDRYDKMFCTSSDVRHYSSGRNFVSFSVNGIRCGLQICYDFRFPELYREYLKRNVQIVFHSFHQVQDKVNQLMQDVGPAHLISRAAENFMYIVANNCINKPHQWWGTRVINPDGSVREMLEMNTEGMLTCEISPEAEREGYYDATHENRYRATAGMLYSEL